MDLGEVITMVIRRLKQLSLVVLLAGLYPVLTIGSASAQSSCLTTKNSSASVSISGTETTAKFSVPANCGAQEVSLVSYETTSANGLPLSAQTVFKSSTAEYAPG